MLHTYVQLCTHSKMLTNWYAHVILVRIMPCHVVSCHTISYHPCMHAIIDSFTKCLYLCPLPTCVSVCVCVSCRRKTPVSGAKSSTLKHSKLCSARALLCSGSFGEHLINGVRTKILHAEEILLLTVYSCFLPYSCQKLLPASHIAQKPGMPSSHGSKDLRLKV